MAEVWPATLPQVFMLSTYNESPADNTIRSQVEVGPAIVRRRSSSNPRPIAGDMAMTPAQLTTLDTFWTTTTLGGVLVFTFPNPRGGTALLCRFTGPPAIMPMESADPTNGALMWKVSFKLEALTS